MSLKTGGAGQGEKFSKFSHCEGAAGGGIIKCYVG